MKNTQGFVKSTDIESLEKGKRTSINGTIIIEYVDEIRLIPQGEPTPEELSSIANLHGYAVPKEAFLHNIDAWAADYKSGYMCDGGFVFSPCRCNGLRFDIEKPNGKDYQKTYIA